MREHGRPSHEQRPPALRAAEPNPSGVRARHLRRRVVHGLLRGPAGPRRSSLRERPRRHPAAPACPPTGSCASVRRIYALLLGNDGVRCAGQIEMKSDRKVFLHLSDIHLREEEIRSGVDRDMDLRSELLRDAQKLKGRAFDCLSGVFLTGDIAFAGKTVEFTSARDWLDQIRAEFTFPQGAVWCVPGNHDVDRTIVAASRNRQRTRESIRRGGEAQAAQELHELLKDDISNTILLEPLRAFNESFAAGFQCTTRFPELCWSDTIPLGDQYQLVLTGLNSAVISDGNDDDDQGRLVLGLHQIHSVRRRSGDIHVSLCHHPPRWLLDRSEVEAFLNSRTTLQLFGHEHDGKLQRVDDSVQVFAGALHPQRGEERWEPSYNLIEIGLLGHNRSTRVRIRIWPRKWDTESTEFRPAITGADHAVEFKLPIHDTLPIEQHDHGLDPTIETSEPTASGDHPPPASTEIVQEAERMPRDIVYLFFLLPLTERLRIALDLGLYRDEDTTVDAAEMGRRVFLRAREQGKLDLLVERLTQNEA